MSRFVDQNPADVEGKKDLAVWNDRLARGMVKVGPAWVLPMERDRLFEEAQGKVETARQLMKQGRTKEAEPFLGEALNVDLRNPSGQYLMGLLRVGQDQLPAARKAFEMVAATVPNHGPTLNNLAIVQWRQRQYLSAMNSFDGAMLALPVNQLILENVAGAIAFLPAEFQTNPAAGKMVQHFKQQEKLLADQMARQGMRRFGSVWVTEKQLQQMKLDEKRMLDALDRLSVDFDRTTQRVRQLDQNISDEMSAISAGFQAINFNLDGDVARIQSERNISVARLDSIKRQADELEASRPSNQNRGVQIMFRAESTPLRVGLPFGK